MSKLLICVSALALWAGPAWAQTQLFPQPFVVEHHLILDEGGTPVPTESVKDSYFGSWIVSERADGSRLIVDLERRELTEIRPELGQYWTIGFDRMAEIRARLAELDELVPAQAAAIEKSSAKAASVAEPEIEVEELVVSGPQAVVAAASGRASDPATRAEVRKFKARVRLAEEDQGEAAAVEVWVDPTVRLNADALRALAAFESSALGATSMSAEVGVMALVAAVRARAGGAFPTRLLHEERVQEGPTSHVVATIEDRVTRLEPAEVDASRLLQVPEGLKKTLHPLEGMFAFAQEDARRRREMAGLGPGN